MERKIKKYKKFINESKDALDNLLDSFLELTDEYLKYGGLSIVEDNNINKLIAFFNIEFSKTIDKENIRDYINMYETIYRSLSRVNMDNFYIKNNVIRVEFNVNEHSKKFLSDIEVGDYLYGIEMPYDNNVIELDMDIIISNDFSFILKVYISSNMKDYSAPKDEMIEFFKKYKIEFVSLLNERNTHEYVFSGNFM